MDNLGAVGVLPVVGSTGRTRTASRSSMCVVRHTNQPGRSGETNACMWEERGGRVWLCMYISGQKPLWGKAEGNWRK